MTATHRRRDITDRVGELLEPHLANGPGKKGRPSRDNRLFLNAVFWNLHTGVPRYQIRGSLWLALCACPGHKKRQGRRQEADIYYSVI